MINADNGSSWFISGTSDPSWDDNDLNQLKKIPGSAFEAVYTGPIKTSPSTMSVTLPRAGDMISGGTLNYLVKCTTANVDSLRSLEFSSDGGTHWSVMAGVTGTNSFTWSTVPDVATTNAKIRVSDELGTTAVSGIFTITSKASSSISNVQVKNVVNSHIGTGIATTISWITTGNVPGPIAAEYSTDNSKWTSINSSIPTSTTSIPWTTPSAAPMMYVRVRSTSDGKIAGTFGPFVIDPAKGVSDVPKNSLSLSVFPNPVSGRTEIRFSISDQEFVSLKIYSSTGIEIASLLSGRIQSAGEHAIAFEARGLSDGVYFCRMFAGGESIAIKMVVAR